MKSRWALSSTKKIKLFFSRFRRLPTVYWAVLASIFGVADFLTWSILADFPPSKRWLLTLGIATGTLIFTVIMVLVRPSDTEATVYARSLSRLARESFNARDYSEAHRLLDAAIQLDNDNIASWSLLGRVLVRIGKFDEALLPLSRGLDLSQVRGNKHIILLNRSIAHYCLGDLGHALDDLNQILDESPTHIEALRLRATVWLQLGRYNNALDDIEKALSKRPTYLCGHAIKAVILKRLRKTRLARAELKQCDALQPDDSVDFYCLSLAYAHLGKVDEALDYLQTSVQHDSKCLYRAERDPLFDVIRENPQFSIIISNHHGNEPPG